MRKHIVTTLILYTLPIIIVSLLLNFIAYIPSSLFSDSIQKKLKYTQEIKPELPAETTQKNTSNTKDSLNQNILHHENIVLLDADTLKRVIDHIVKVQEFNIQIEEITIFHTEIPPVIVMKIQQGMSVILDGAPLSKIDVSAFQQLTEEPNTSELLTNQNELITSLTTQLGILDLVLHGTNISEIDDSIIEIDVRYKLPILRTTNSIFTTE